MPTKAVFNREICPFTCETFHDCYAARTVPEQQECPFTLEICVLHAGIAHHAQTRSQIVKARLFPQAGSKERRNSFMGGRALHKG